MRPTVVFTLGLGHIEDSMERGSLKATPPPLPSRTKAQVFVSPSMSFLLFLDQFLALLFASYESSTGYHHSIVKGLV